jgi:acetoin utilization deacetylase AcuC-like enzyme
MLDEGFAYPGDFVSPAAASERDLLLVHDREWIDKLKHGTLSFLDIRRLEVPYSRRMAEAFFLAAGGTTLAARSALAEGVGFNIGGGFHHAFEGHGEGFCAINDVAVAVRVLEREQRIRHAMVLDCDVHHGNGTAAIFADDPAVFTISLHQQNNYPEEKPPSTIDVPLADGVQDKEYLDRLSDVYRTAFDGFRPDILFYDAGADPYCEDQLGGLSLTQEGLAARDQMVLETALERKVPVVVTLAGGYATEIADTVAIHFNTARVASECLRAARWDRRASGRAQA